MYYYIKFVDDFYDGNVLPHKVARGTEMSVPEDTYHKIVQSGCVVEVLGKAVPPSTVEKKGSSATTRTKVVKKAGNGDKNG